VASAWPGVVQAAATLLGALAVSQPSRVESAVGLLEECLQSTNVPTAEAAMRALAKSLQREARPKTARQTAPRAGATVVLSHSARERITTLAQEEPKRLGPLAEALLA
jgi:hypothetical protein